MAQLALGSGLGLGLGELESVEPHVEWGCKGHAKGNVVLPQDCSQRNFLVGARNGAGGLCFTAQLSLGLGLGLGLRLGLG